MSFLKRILKRSWQDCRARGDSHRDAGEQGLALQEYRAALASFDGSDEERGQLEARVAACQKRLRQSDLEEAVTHVAAGSHREALYALESALDHSVTEQERREVREKRRRLLDEEVGAAGPIGRMLGADIGKNAPPGKKRRPRINYLATGQHSYTMLGFLKGFGRPLADEIGVIPYESLDSVDQLPCGTYIFSDLERLGAAHRCMLAMLWDQLEASDADVRLLNHPTRTMPRYELLRTLHEKGQNRFNVYRLGEEPRPLQRPVFLRHADEHEGSFSELISDEQDLDEAAGRLMMSGFEPEVLLVVEYCETADPSGMYRKYSAFRVGDRIVPRHLIHSRKWMLKYPDLIDAELLEEDRRYMEENPHEEQLWELFELANVDYGRIDYSLLDADIQVWEINTNPIVMAAPEKYREALLPAQEFFAPLIIEAFRAIDLGPAARGRAHISYDAELVRKLVAAT